MRGLQKWLGNWGRWVGGCVIGFAVPIWGASVADQLTQIEARLTRMASLATANHNRQPRPLRQSSIRERSTSDVGSSTWTQPEFRAETVAVVGQFGSTTGCFRDPTAIGVDARYVTVVDSGNQRIVRMTHQLDQWSSFRPVQNDRLDWSSPYGLAQSGRSWVVTDVQTNQVLILKDWGAVRQRIGGFGIASGRFDFPVAVIQHPNRQWWVVDQRNRRIQRFSESWEFQSELGSTHPSAPPLRHPVDIAMGPNGWVWVADTALRLLRCYDESGQFIQDVTMNVQSIGGLAIDATGQMIVTDPDADKIWILSATAQVIGVIDTPAPTDVAIWGNYLFVIDSKNAQIRCIQWMW